MNTELSFKDLKALKENGLLNENEIAFLRGDVVVAENISTKQQRILETNNIVLECKKKLLKG